MKQRLAKIVLAIAVFVFALSASRNVLYEVFEDGSVRLFNVVGFGFCLPGGICNEGD